MKCTVAVLLVALGAAQAARLDVRSAETPMARVVGLLSQLEAKIQSEGKAEQASYDKYACWCEETLGRKANDISSGKELVDETLASIKKLKAEVSAHGAEIKQLTKDIAANIEGQREATEVRDKDHEDFVNEKNENEQCTGALEAAIKVLTGAGENRKQGFLETLQEAKLMSVVSGVRSVLKTPHAKSMNNKDLDLISRFVEHPEDFMGNRAGLVAAQVANNPFGDYAPQSTAIQGILKGMYDSFTMDIEKDNAEESDSQKSHEALIATKQAELKTLQDSLDSQELEEAQKSKKLADNQALLDDTQEQLKADELFFEETKDTCKVKAKDWANRSRMRTEELAGIGKAIEIMSSDDAQSTFESATSTFLQIRQETSDPKVKAYKSLSGLARKYKSYNLAQMAATLEAGGHFDKVITAIDTMISDLRTEEQEDIQHRDRCERAMNKNANNMEDAEHQMKKSAAAIKRLEDEASAIKSEIKKLEDAISDTKKDMKDLLDMRNTAVDEFKQAMKDDTDAIALLEQAITALSGFYKKNKIEGVAMAQKDEPEYSANADAAPKLSYEGARTDGGVSGGKSYGGRQGETSGIIGIIKMLKEDLEAEVRTASKDNAAAEEEYEKQRAALKESEDAQTKSKISAEKELMEVDKRIDDISTFSDQQGSDLGDEKELELSIEKDCSWVKTHFESRREKRKAEMEGLEEAKNYLAGVESLR
jgi:hypothetical protein